MNRVFKVRVSVPEEYADRMMDAIDANMEPVYPGYTRTFSIVRSKGTWVSEKGSKPFIGKQDEAVCVEELILEFAVKEKDLKEVLRAIGRKHPYEEPGVDVIEIIPWRSLL